MQDNQIWFFNQKRGQEEPPNITTDVCTIMLCSSILTHIGLICDQLGHIYSVIATYGLKHVCFAHLRNDLRNIYKKIIFFHPSPFPWGNSCPGNCISWCREWLKQLYNWGQQRFATSRFLMTRSAMSFRVSSVALAT